MKVTNDYAPCAECDEFEAHNLHHTELERLPGVDPHPFDSCNFDASYEGEEKGYVVTTDCHEYEPGCYCADNGQCEYCVEKSVMYGDYLRSIEKDG